MGNYRVCLCFIRRFKMIKSEPPSDVKEAFKKYAVGGTHMTADQLRLFLIDVQDHDGGPGSSIPDVHRIIEQVLQRRHPVAKFIRQTLSLDDFYFYLFSPDLNPPISDQVEHDMRAPMSHYFIYTGHNSYLMGNQVSSDCSDIPIIKSLKMGVRVVELDLWPNSNEDDVDVLHGRTLTTPVELSRCLKSIKENAFLASPYPVIITLEDHLPPNLQVKVAQMINETFGEMVFCPESESIKEFPSPEDLKYRIIISTKPPKEYLKSNSINPKDSNEDDCSDEQECDGDNTSGSDSSARSDGSDSESMHSGVSEYKRLIAIHAGRRKGSLSEMLKIEVDKIKRLSLNEKALKKATRSHGTDVIRFTQNNFLRVFPKATRLNSSNYKPHNAWLHGAQMVAFNMQGYGKSLWLMQGMFRSNGGCGYVKKPDFLLKRDPQFHNVFDPKTILPVKQTLKVKIYGGDGWNIDFEPTHFDLYSPPDFYTRIGIAGVPGDETMQKTKIKEDTWTPIWNEEFIFLLSDPELALLRIEVYDKNMAEKDKFAGQNCLPVSELKPGFRAVPLFDRKGHRYNFVKLLMRFEYGRER